MNFERLNSSIKLNAREEPTIYMACCMIESLLKDLEAESGASGVSKLPVGDETLPTKLIWLVREINKIYDEKKDEFQRNRKRLDSMMESLSDREAELSALYVDDAKLSARKAQERELEDRLSEARRRREAYDALAQRCADLQKEIDSLADAAPEEQNAVLARLTEERDALIAKQAQLEGALAAARLAAEEAKSACAETEAEIRQTQNACAALQTKKENAEAEARQLRSQTAELQATTDALSVQNLRQQQSKAVLEAQCEQLQAALDAYEREEILPVKESHRELTAALGAAQTQRSELQAALEETNAEHAAAVLEVSRLHTTLKDEEQALQGKEEELNKLREQVLHLSQTKKQTQEEIYAQTQTLSQTQEEVRVLEEETLPEINGYLEKEETHLRALEEETARLETERTALAVQLRSLEEEAAALTAALETARAEQAAQTMEYEEKNKELSILRQKLEAMEGKNDKRRAREYRQQLEQGIAELEAAEKECAVLEEELHACSVRLESQRLQVQTLQSQKKEQDAAEREVGLRLEKLRPLTDAAVLARIEKNRSRLAMLRDAGDRLNAAVALMSGALLPEAQGNLPDAEGIVEALEQYEDQIVKLQNALLRCAQSVKPELYQS